ncbi:signal peptide peptidase SppA [Azospirillum sp. TSO22-1]|uniref:signal peptide peptidase SppA n=1 Tax=Azospirillum sp. TSO22-1 TaxID=716789 RepID=UPI000D617793|nr:signal peptide peptidase SppA [Azospirillum sp. TSO22-1]PWC44375.1 protease IV [Azospirillum sp. TSO22-1]
MLRFLVRLFAFIGFLVVTGIGTAVWYLWTHEEPLPNAVVLTLDLDKPLSSRPDADALGSLLGREASLRDVLDALERARTDARVKGLLVRIGGHEPGFAEAQEIRNAVERFRATGRFALAFAEGFGEGGAGNRSYYLATGFDEVWVQPLGDVGITGLAAQIPFARGALDQLGIQPQVQQREEYKSFADTFTQRDLTPANREMTQALLSDLSKQLVDGIAKARRLDVNEVRALIDRAPLMDQEALQARLIDRIGYRDEAEAEARRRAGGGETVELTDYLDAAGPPHRDGPVVALIHAVGTISRGESEGRGISEVSAGSDTIVEAFDKAVEDDDVKAILFRVDSGGGSVTASESIRRAVVRARERGKPVVVSMGDAAASGGYWISMNADRIVAMPGTITGSIGVVAGKMSLEGLSEKLGVHWGVVADAKNAGMWSPFRAFNESEQARLTAMIDRTYASFLAKVAEARRLPADKVRAAAKGRVWTGQQALGLGLVDELGDTETALMRVREAIGLKPDAPVALEPFPPPKSTLEEIRSVMSGKGLVRDAVARELRAWLGPLLDVAEPGVRAKMPAVKF